MWLLAYKFTIGSVGPEYENFWMQNYLDLIEQIITGEHKLLRQWGSKSYNQNHLLQNGLKCEQLDAASWNATAKKM